MGSDNPNINSMADKKTFFEEGVSSCTYCEECGIPIHNPGYKNVAHIIPKSIFKSVMYDPRNRFCLCTNFDRGDGGTGCHERYDSSWEKAKRMKIWPRALEIVKDMEPDIIERHKMLFLHFLL